MNPTSISAHILNKLNIPAYDKNDPIHDRISAVCKEGHGKTDISEYIEKLDELVCGIYMSE